MDELDAIGKLINQYRRQLEYLLLEQQKRVAMGAYPGTPQATGPLFDPFDEEPDEVPVAEGVPKEVREKCPLCGAKIGLNLASPFLAYNDSPRVRHLMDVHKRSLDEAQAIIKRHHGR